MKASIRWWSRLAFVAGVGLSAFTACSSDKPDRHGEEKQSGTLALALQATAPSGSVYQLRNAFFQITDVRSGETVDFLFSDNGLPTAQELTTMLFSGDYTVTLLPGWQLERVSRGGGGTGGTSAGGTGPVSGGTGPIPEGGFGGAFDDVPPFPGKAGGAPQPPRGKAGGLAFGGTASGEAAGAGGEGGEGGNGIAGSSSGGSAPIGGDSGVGGSFGVGGSSVGGSSVGGSFGAGGSFGGGEIVEAQLLSTAVQFVTIFGGLESFVHYQFRVGSEIIDFRRGRLRVGIGVDDSEACVPPPDVTLPERVLLESNLDAVAPFTLLDALEAIRANAAVEAEPVALFNQVFDSFASASQGRMPDAVHCGDEVTDGVPTLNGYPLECDRDERNHVGNPFTFQATAFVNRIDMAPLNGAHCGQQRMIFASNARNRALVIVEAQIPNPNPELGIDGCRPLAQFWLDQNAIPDAKLRGERLSQAFFRGAPELAAFGFGPFYTPENLTVGSGQIRTNTFDSDPWTLREFKLALDGESIKAVPFPVAEAPHGALWNENVPLPQGEACRQDFLNAIEGLLTDNLEQMSFVVDGACKDAESRADFSQDYASQLSNGFRQQLEQRLVGTGLSAQDIANRAQFAGSCIGCHNESSGRFLGNGVFAPFQFDFPQVNEFPQPCSGGEVGLCFPTSDGLRRDFLPTRLSILGGLLDVPVVPNPCSAGGSGGTSGGPIPIRAAGGIDLPQPAEPGEAEPAPVVVIELPSSDEPVEVLQEVDEEIRELYGEQTLSGRSAQATH